MITVFSIFLSIVFLALATLHFHWAVGGRWGFESALPTTEEGKKILNPRKIDSAIVGIGLLFFAVFYFFEAGIIENKLPLWTTGYMGWIIPFIFILRAIGDFKYIGFFKKIKQTDFGKMDTRFYSPLCFVVGIIGMAVIYLHK